MIDPKYLKKEAEDYGITVSELIECEKANALLLIGKSLRAGLGDGKSSPAFLEAIAMQLGFGGKGDPMNIKIS